MNATTLPKPAGWIARQTSTTGPSTVDIRHVVIARCTCGAEQETGIRDHIRPVGMDSEDENARVLNNAHAWTDRHLRTCTAPAASNGPEDDDKGTQTRIPNPEV
ncbi:hypothetical protein ACWCPS_36010 [Streptomyces mauvecolor]